MEQLYESDGSRHGRNTNINQFAPIFESENEQVAKHRAKTMTTIIVPSQYQEENEKKGEQNKYNEEDEDDQKNKKTMKTDNPDSDDGLN